MIGVGITTLNRRPIFTDTLNSVLANTKARVVVVDDGSDDPVTLTGVEVHRNPIPQGIARAKNHALRMLMAYPDVDDIFLLDDDVTVGPGWWRPYVDSPYGHLCHIPTATQTCGRCHHPTVFVYDTVSGDMVCTDCHPTLLLWRQDGHKAAQWGPGALLYYTRDCVTRIGGMRPQFGRYGFEHWEHSYRAHNTGHCPMPFTDVTDANITLMDATTRGKRSSVPEDIRRARNWAVFQQFSASTDCVPLTEPDIRLTVCTPWRAQPDRIGGHEAAKRWWTSHNLTVIDADSDPDKPFLCNQARNNAVRQADTDIVVLADGDTICENINQIHAAADLINTGQADVVWPFTLYRHIPASAITLPDPSQAEVIREYHGSPGGIIVVNRAAYWSIGGYDERFTPGAWAWDDTAFLYAAETLLNVQRIPGVVYSYDHTVDNAGHQGRDLNASPNKPRFQLYEFARNKPAVMAELIK